MFDKRSLSEQVKTSLQREIVRGNVAPGERVNVGDYVKKWKISVTPFRDALHSLQMQGFVTIEPRKGVFIARLGPDALKEIFDVRIALECMAVELASPLVPMQIVEKLQADYEQLVVRLERGEDVSLSKEDTAVHDLARTYCGNSRLKSLLADQRELILWAQNTIIREIPKSYEMALPEHLKIVAALCRRDGAQAATAMRNHLENSLDRIVSELSKRPKTEN